eukprot:gene1289-167_t
MSEEASGDSRRELDRHDSVVVRPATEAEQVAFLMTQTHEVDDDGVEVLHASTSPPRENGGAAPSSLAGIPCGTPPKSSSEDSAADVIMQEGGSSPSDSIVFEESSATAAGFQQSALFRRSDTHEPDLTECPVCFDDLCTEPLAIMLAGRPPVSPNLPGNQRSTSVEKRAPRSCRHFLHYRCLNQVQKHIVSECPLCRASFVSFVELVDIRHDPRTWFRQVSMSGDDNFLQQQEIIDALGAVLPVASEFLATEVKKQWSTWTTSDCGKMTLEEFVEPRRGMLQWVLYNLPQLGAGKFSNQDLSKVKVAHIPDLVDNKESWFRFWDSDGAQALTFQQLFRGLVKTFRLEGQFEVTRALRSSLQEIWTDFGLEGRGSVSLALFVEQDTGLLDTLTAQLKAAIGLKEFNRLLRQSRIYEMPVSDLKRALVRHGKDPSNVLEKSELVSMLIEAETQAAIPTAPPERKRSREIDSEDAQRKKLRTKGVNTDHCVMKDELVDLMLMYARQQKPIAARPKQNAYNGSSASASAGNSYVPRDLTGRQFVRRVVCGLCQTVQDIPGGSEDFVCYQCKRHLKVKTGGTNPVATEQRNVPRQKSGRRGKKDVRCFGPSSSTTRAKLRNFVALAQELSSESHEDVIRNVDKYADIGTPLRKVSPKVYQLVDEIATLDATEAKQLQDRLIKKLTAEPPKKPKGWEPFPVRARVPFPHPEALLAGIFCNRMPGVGAQTVHPLAQMMMMPHFAKMMEGQQAQQPAAAQPEAVAAAEGDGEEAEEKKEEVKTEKAIVSIKLEEFA